MPTPSITANNTAQPIAPFRICLYPPRTAREPPVKNPAMMAFHGSSFLRTPLTAQSKVLNKPPHTGYVRAWTGALEASAHTSEIAAQNRCAHLDGCNGAYPSLAVRAVSESLDAVPYRTANGLASFVSVTSQICSTRACRGGAGWREDVHP